MTAGIFAWIGAQDICQRPLHSNGKHDSCRFSPVYSYRCDQIVELFVLTVGIYKLYGYLNDSWECGTVRYLSAKRRCSHTQNILRTSQKKKKSPIVLNKFSVENHVKKWKTAQTTMGYAKQKSCTPTVWHLFLYGTSVALKLHPLNWCSKKKWNHQCTIVSSFKQCGWIEQTQGNHWCLVH